MIQRKNYHKSIKTLQTISPYYPFSLYVPMIEPASEPPQAAAFVATLPPAELAAEMINYL